MDLTDERRCRMTRCEIVSILVLGISLGAGTGRETRGHEPSAKPKPPKAAVIPKKLEQFGRDCALTTTTGSRTGPTPRSSPISTPRTPTPTRSCRHTKGLQKRLYDEIVGRIKQADSDGARLRQRLLLLHPVRNGEAVSDPGPQEGLARGRRGDPARRECDGRGTRLFLAGRLAGQPGQPPARLRHRHRRPPLLHDPRSRTSPPASCSTTRSPTSPSNVAWANDSRTLFYTKQDPNTLRAYRVLPPSPGHSGRR